MRRGVRRLGSLLLPALALSALACTLAAVAWQAGLFGPIAAHGYALGEHHDGEALPATHPLVRHHWRVEQRASAQRASAQRTAASAAVPQAMVQTAAASGADLDTAVQSAPTGGSSSRLSLRYGCVWGQPGRNPYRGSVEQALRSAALPEEVVRSVAAQVRSKEPVDTLEISNTGVRALASGRVFDATNIALTYGTTLCLGSRVNFEAGHVEKAALYEAAAADGRVLAVMVPEVCGNVSVLGQSDERVKYERLNGLVSQTNGANGARWMPAVLMDPDAGAGRSGPAVNDVPEPGTLACALAALGALGFVRWLRRPR